MKAQELFKNYPVALIAGASILIFSGLAVWRSSVAADLKETLASRESEAGRLSENVHNSQKLDTQVEQMNALNEKIAARLSNPNDLASNQQYFYKFESDSKVKLLDLTKTNVSRGLKKKNALTFYSTVPYSLKVQGDYAHLLSFLRAVESGPRISIIEVGQMDGPSGGKNQDDLGPTAPMTLSLDVQLLGSL